MGTTLAEKVWADHLVRQGSDGAPDLLYIDLMLMHEVTSPQAFEGLRLAGRKPRHVDQLIATEDHNTPTVDIDRPNPDKTSALQLSTLEKNCEEFGVRLHPLGDADQGIVHAFAPIKDIAVDTVFIGSCTNGRIDDLRQAASIMKGHHKAENIHRVLVVPASSRVRLQAEKEGLDKVFEDFGAEWRNAGCSMCLGMNPDKLVPGERSISTSNRNFEGRQGKGSRTHLASPAVAAATAIRGTISSPADL